jgi:hypothetical protein
VVSFWHFLDNRRGTAVSVHVTKAKLEVHNNNTNTNTSNNNNNSGENKRKMAQEEDAFTTARNLDEKLVDTEQSYRWLKSGDIKGETESKIVAAQDQAISTNYFKNNILKEEINAGCVNNVKKLLPT